MRNYVINEAQSRLAYGRLTWLVRLVKNWRIRKYLKRLQLFSDYQLLDIGLSRHELNHLAGLPLDRDTAWETESLAFMDTKYENLSGERLVDLKNGLASSVVLAYPVWKEDRAL